MTVSNWHSNAHHKGGTGRKETDLGVCEAAVGEEALAVGDVVLAPVGVRVLEVPLEPVDDVPAVVRGGLGEIRLFEVVDLEFDVCLWWFLHSIYFLWLKGSAQAACLLHVSLGGPG